MQERGMEADPRYAQLMQLARQFHIMQGGGGQMPPQSMMMGGGQQMQQDPYGQGMMGMQRGNMGPRMDPNQVRLLLTIALTQKQDKILFTGICLVYSVYK